MNLSWSAGRDGWPDSDGGLMMAGLGKIASYEVTRKRRLNGI